MRSQQLKDLDAALNRLLGNNHWKHFNCTLANEWRFILTGALMTV